MYNQVLVTAACCHVLPVPSRCWRLQYTTDVDLSISVYCWAATHPVYNTTAEAQGNMQLTASCLAWDSVAGSLLWLVNFAAATKLAEAYTSRCRASIC
jgi:hypothetical protein